VLLRRRFDAIPKNAPSPVAVRLAGVSDSSPDNHP
jgi:hypothetical protein